MSNAGEEYKSKALDFMLKKQGIHILQSALHAPQQNGCAEWFMHTVMDKSEAMHHEACIPESWWEFSIAHATQVYNCIPLHFHNWWTPFEILYVKQPKKASQCLRSFTRQHKLLTRVGELDWVRFEGWNFKRIRLGLPVDSLALIYHHRVCTYLYWIYWYSLGQA